MKGNESSDALSLSFRVYYGKLFSAFLNQFGEQHLQEIEDAIQNAFLKALKSWKLNKIPESRENWLYIVAKNDLLNQLKKKKTYDHELPSITEEEGQASIEDLRLKTILFLATTPELSYLAKVLFILKNIFGLHIREISKCTLLSEDAVYKNVSRSKQKLLASSINQLPQKGFENASNKEIALVEETLHAVFTIGFDSFNNKVESTINDDLCVEALALTKLLIQKYEQISTKNLLSLFCFHLARIPAKVEEGRLIPFLQQDKSKWNQELIKLGFHFLRQPKQFDAYYFEAVITSKHMIASEFTQQHWDEIIMLYKVWLENVDSPLIKLNLCYCLNQANRFKESLKLLEEIEAILPKQHFYFSLVKAEVLQKEDSSESNEIISNLLVNMGQQIRIDYLTKKLKQNL